MASTEWRQAVIFIHGVGEQRPMESLRAFASTVLTKRKDGKRSEHNEICYFSKPDHLTETLELRRLSASPDYVQVPTDFYELYWAHLMQGTAWSHVAAWVWMLMLRNPWHDRVSMSIRMLWTGSWVGLIAGVMCIVVFDLSMEPPKLLGYGLLGVAAYVALRLIGFAGLRYAGDAARYLSPLPQNIEARKNIRNAVIGLLKKLHEEEDHRYHRIIVVGHSLGSVIAYDALTHLWQSRHSKLVTDPVGGQPELEQSRRLGLHLTAGYMDDETREGLVERYRVRQRRLWAEQLRIGIDWRITDLVTLGSPLTHYNFLLSRGQKEWEMMTKQREYPTAPPQAEDNRDQEQGESRLQRKVISFQNEKNVRILHHAALFACTRWTNLYFAADPLAGRVGGPDRFGLAVKDVRLNPVRFRSRSPLAHTAYWSEGETSARDELLRALRLDEGKAPPEVAQEEPDSDCEGLEGTGTSTWKRSQ